MTNIPGFYGKFPELGDFVNRRLPQEFIEPWDDWLQASIIDSKDQLTESWLNSYLTSPIWRFVLGRGLVGEFPWCGLIMPSVDRVGRYFPLTLACKLPREANLIKLIAVENRWFEQAEEVLLKALEDGFVLETFDNSVVSLGNLDDFAGSSNFRSDVGFGQAWQIPLASANGTIDLSGLTNNLLIQRLGNFSAWWGSGSDTISPSLLICSSLPKPKDYASMLMGNWSQGTWEKWVEISNDQL